MLKIQSLYLGLSTLIFIGCVGDLNIVETDQMGGMQNTEPPIAAFPMTSGQGDSGQMTAGVAEPGGMSINPLPLGGSEDSCVPGERIGICTVCGPDGRYIAPTNDPECEPVDCSVLNSYYTVIEDDGAETCMEEVAVRLPGTCRTRGECHTTTETACEMGEPIAQGTVYPGCGAISGCNSTNSPSIRITPQGGTCHAFGECTNMGGPCSVSDICEGFELAAGGTRQTFCDIFRGNTCRVAVDANNIDNLEEINCLTYCASADKICDGAWSSNGGCTEVGPITCQDPRNRVICACKEPPNP